MYRALPKKWIYLALVWGALSLWALISAWNAFSSQHPFLAGNFKWTAVPGLLWMLINFGIANCWRWIWALFPILNRRIYPDLNGLWDVEMLSNWPRQEQTLKAAAGSTPPVNMLVTDQLSDLGSIKLKALVKQTFWRFDMTVWSETKNTPIKRSRVISVDPFRAIDQNPAGMFYVYEQENDTDAPWDDPIFHGAARIEYDGETGVLTGEFWTQRAWRRAINTAGQIKFQRSISKGNKRNKNRPALP